MMSSTDDCAVCGQFAIVEEQLTLHSTCGQKYHSTCYDALLRREKKVGDRIVPPFCLYCSEKLHPRRAEAPVQCVICQGDIWEDTRTSLRVFTHNTCHQTYHTSCLDAWLHREATAGKCAYCRQVLFRIPEWFPVDPTGMHDHRVEVVRRIGRGSVLPEGWCLPPFNFQYHKRLAPVVANYQHVEEAGIPFYKCPVLPSLRRQFPVPLDGFSLMTPMVVEVAQLQAKRIPIHFITSDDYRQLAFKIESEYNEYCCLFARYFYFHPPSPSPYTEVEDLVCEEQRPARTDPPAPTAVIQEEPSQEPSQEPPGAAADVPAADP